MSSIGGGSSVAEQALALLLALSDPETHKNRIKDFAEAEKAANLAQRELERKSKAYQELVAATTAKETEIAAREAAVKKAEAEIVDKHAAVNAMHADYTAKMNRLKAMVS
jgi:hypothetical protein